MDTHYIYHTTTACTTFRLFIQSLSKNYLLFLSFRLLAKALAKVRGFFLTTKFFRSFFSKKIFQRSETGTASPSRSLSTAKVRYKATTDKPETSRSLCQCFSAFLSRKRVQNYALFRKLQLLHDFFLTFPESFFVRHWKTAMLRGIFFYRTQKEEENMHNNIYCAGGRMRAKKNTPHYPQKATRRQNNAFSSLKQRHLFTKNTPSFLKITAYFFQHNEQTDYQYRRKCTKRHCFFK